MLRRACSYVLGWMCLLAAVSAVSAPVYVPSDLEPWKAWVLQGEDFRKCPFLSNAPGPSPDSFRCGWPERLTLTLDSRGGTFSQRWQLSGESWIQVPGDLEHWPVDVRVDGGSAHLVARANVPQLHLPPGEHQISGAFHFVRRPEQIAIDPRTALVELTLDGHQVPQPERPEGGLWLGNPRTSDEPQRMLVQVYRLVRDEVPVNLTTLIRLSVSGGGREESLGRVLPDGFTPVSLESEAPARLEPDGRLRIQVRAGRWEIRVVARGSSSATELRRPATQGQWADEEIWSFAGDDRLRVAAAEGPQGVDPNQANVPGEWQEYPAFRMTPDSVLRVTERTRGLQNTDENNLRLDRRLWLDFDEHGWTAVDRISGTMRRTWRLEMASPFRLESALEGERPLLISQNSAGTGVEVRSPDLDLSTTARLPSGSGSMPATGWRTRFVQGSGELNLPPGHRLIAVVGADHVEGAWLEDWGLWAVFGVLVVAVVARWLRGWLVGVVALVGLALMYPEAPGYFWLWANVLAAVAAATAVPEGRLRRFLRGYRAVSFVVLGVVLLPFLFDQVRLALYPQLEVESPALPYLPRALTPAQLPARDFASPRTGLLTGTVAAAPSSALLSEVVVTGKRRAEVDEGASGGAAPEYATGTVLQAGPAIPSWRYHAYEYSWSGALESGQSMRFVFVGPLALAAWRIAGAALLAVLFLALLEPRGFRGILAWISTAARRAPAAVLLLPLVYAPVESARAAPIPDAAILDQLKVRLTRPPECSPTCADIGSAAVSVHDEQLQVTLLASALASLAIPIPTAGDRWQLTGVTVDDRAALAVGRETDGTTWIPVTTGAHTIVLTGRLSGSRSLQLAFPLVPHRVSVFSQGWEVTGLNDEQHLISGSLELAPRRASNDGGTALASSSDFPAFVRVTRLVSFDLNWNVRTTVDRIAPATGALTVEVPLLEGESVLGSLQTRTTPDGRTAAVVGLEPDAVAKVWTSSLAQNATLHFAQPVAETRIEVWKFVATPQWHLAFNGVPAVLPENANGGPWTYEFYPRPGEQLEVSITRPEAAAGSSLAIESVQQRSRLGRRASQTTLQLAYRSTQGGRHTLQIPPSAQVTALEIDGKPASLRPERGELSLALLPGEHSIEVRWMDSNPVRSFTRLPAVDLHAPAGNVTTTIESGPDRWVLFAFGSGLGPAILYWAELGVFLIVATLLGRWPASPLRTREWILLGLGLSMLSWAVLMLVAVWLWAMRWRAGWAGEVGRWRFNLTQSALAVLTVCAVGALVLAGIRQALVSAPDMSIAGDGSAAGVLAWFVDHTAGPLPRPEVISAPLWLYRLLMFAWAFWAAAALLRWTRGAWEAWRGPSGPGTREASAYSQRLSI